MTEWPMIEWIDQELTRQLAPVPAPEGLWNRIHEQRRPLRVTRRFNKTWAIAGVALFLLLAGSAGQRSLRVGEIHCADPAEVRAWIRNQVGFDVPLPDQPPAGGEPVSLISARFDRRRGEPAAAITYRVGNDVVDMRVGPARQPSGRHSQPRIESTATTRTVSWEMGDESYAVTLTAAAASDHACVLCHTDPTGLVAFN